MVGRAERLKGHNFERQVVHALRWIFDRCARGFQTRGGTGEEPDVTNTPFYIECKASKNMPSVRGALVQATEGTDGRIPVAICKKDREEPIVGMYMKHWLYQLEHGILNPKGCARCSHKGELPAGWKDYNDKA